MKKFIFNINWTATCENCLSGGVRGGKHTKCYDYKGIGVRNMIDFELYRIFVAVADEENITRASEKLNISQPAITKQIKNLENQLSINYLNKKVRELL